MQEWTYIQFYNNQPKLHNRSRHSTVCCFAIWLTDSPLELEDWDFYQEIHQTLFYPSFISLLVSSFAEANGCYGSMNTSMLYKLSLTAPPWDQEFAPWWQNEKPAAAANTSKNLCTANTGSWEKKMCTIKQYANQTDSNFLRPILHLPSWNSASRVYCRILCRPDG